MPDLRKQLIRLAHENPGEVRDAVLPLLKDAAKMDPLEKAVQKATNALLKTSGRGSQLDLAKDLVDAAFMASTKHPKANNVHKSLNRVSKAIVKAEAALKEAEKYASEAESWF